MEEMPASALIIGVAVEILSHFSSDLATERDSNDCKMSPSLFPAAHVSKLAPNGETTAAEH